jgi:hypothetical protein
MHRINPLANENGRITPRKSAAWYGTTSRRSPEIAAYVVGPELLVESLRGYI